jgi:hypothetical protein
MLDKLKLRNIAQNSPCSCKRPMKSGSAVAPHVSTQMTGLRLLRYILKSTPGCTPQIQWPIDDSAAFNDIAGQRISMPALP